MKRISVIYFVILLVVGLGIFEILHLGSHIPSPSGSPAGVVSAPAPPLHPSHPSLLASVQDALAQNFHEPLSLLFVQLLVIIAASRCVGWLFTCFGQPAVVGEMTAGILLGPSLFGLLAPDAFHFVFSAASLGTLKLLSQIGVCLFMFTVGMELDIAQVRRKTGVAVLVSHASIVIPYLLGVILALFLYTEFAQPGATFLAFALFMGISMSITAFPVLARILQERGLSQTFLGSTAITCAAVDDVTAWSILAFVVAIVRSNGSTSSICNLALVIVFIGVMLGLIKPSLQRWIDRGKSTQPDPSRNVLVVVILVVLASALTTEIIGIHALFGAFLAGVVMPQIGGFRQKLSVRVENFSSVLLLPLFFAFTGLRTRLGLLNDVQSWEVCLLIIAVATIGKLGGSSIAARLAGIGWRDSLRLGALMNTRGLMELIALNIGYDLGILSPRIFTMLVMMALVTTMMTGPLLTLFGKKETTSGNDSLPSPTNPQAARNASLP